MNWKKNISKLWEPVNSISIDLFRKIFAVLLILQVGEFYSADMIGKSFLLPKTNIPFEFSAWLPVLHGKLIHIPFILQIISGVLLFSNKYSRVGALLYLLNFGYIFLLDLSYYNNHFYFILLLCLFFIFYNPVKIKNINYVPKILLYLFQFQIVVVYFYGGIAKLNADWLFHQEPMREMLSLSNSHHWPESIVYIYTYGGLLFDLMIGFFLLKSSTRKTAIIATILFHIFNHIMFSSKGNASIGLFPFLMISTNLLFIDPEKVQSWFLTKFPAYFKKDAVKKNSTTSVTTFTVQRKKIILISTFLFVLAQLLLPLRHFLIPGNVDWTGEGHYFSWRMKIRSKSPVNTIYVKSDASAPLQKVEPFTVLNTLQYQAVCNDPASMLFFVRYLKDMGKKMGMKAPEFYLSWKCSMNGHPATTVVDSTIEFSTLTHHPLSGDKWILPFK